AACRRRRNSRGSRRRCRAARRCPAFQACREDRARRPAAQACPGLAASCRGSGCRASRGSERGLTRRSDGRAVVPRSAKGSEMALKIRLARAGTKKRPYYHVVIADSRAPRDGRFIERIGHFNPLVAKDAKDRLKLDLEKAKAWLGKGATPTDRVLRFL